MSESETLISTISESEKCRSNLDCHLNIAYGKSPREKLDIYGDDLKKDSPLLVFIHGGYWQMCNKWDSAWFAKTFVDLGFRVISVDYDLCPFVTLETIVKQLKKAFEWISFYVKEHQIKELTLLGHSAGAHLLATSLDKNFINSIDELVNINTFFISGIYDLSELWKLKTANENNILSLDESNCLKLSPHFYSFSHLQNRNLSHLIYVGEYESQKFKEQSKNFSEALKNQLPDRKVQFKIVENCDHFDIVEKLSQSDYEMTRIICCNVKK